MIIAGRSLSRAEQLAQELTSEGIEALAADLMSPPPAAVSGCRLWVVDASAGALAPGDIPASWSQGIPSSAEMAWVLPILDVTAVGRRLAGGTANHFYGSDGAITGIRRLAERLVRGDRRGLERHLPADHESPYRARICDFRGRRDVLTYLEKDLIKRRVRGALRRSSLRVAEELLMNAMYQAPVGETGEKLFAAIPPERRVHQKTPRLVTLRFSVVERTVLLAVEDRYGSLRREDLARYWGRSMEQEAVVERKTIGAGLGLHVVAMASERLAIIVQKGQSCEVVCALTEGSALGESPLMAMSLLTTEG